MATKGKVTGVIANMVLLAVDGPVAQNEICYIKTGGDRLMAEVIKVNGAKVYVQVFESTRRLKIGEEAEFTGHMLEVSLAPGMLSKNYDGLQNDLDKMEGVFLKRGDYTNPLDEDKIWHFEPIVKVGDVVEAAAWLGKVEENHQNLKIMAPFGIEGKWTVKSIAAEGDYKITDTIAVIVNAEGEEKVLSGAYLMAGASTLTESPQDKDSDENEIAREKASRDEKKKKQRHDGHGPVMTM